MTPMLIALIVIAANVLVVTISTTVMVYTLKHVHVDMSKLNKSTQEGAVNDLEARLAQLQTMRFAPQRQVIIPERRVKR